LVDAPRDGVGLFSPAVAGRRGGTRRYWEGGGGLRGRVCERSRQPHRGPALRANPLHPGIFLSPACRAPDAPATPSLVRVRCTRALRLPPPVPGVVATVPLRRRRGEQAPALSPPTCPLARARRPANCRAAATRSTSRRTEKMPRSQLPALPLKASTAPTNRASGRMLELATSSECKLTD